MRITPNDTVTADKAVIPALLATNIPSIAVFSAFNNNESTAGADNAQISFGIGCVLIFSATSISGLLQFNLYMSFYSRL